MTRLHHAARALGEAYAARDAARDRARQEVDRQFAPVIARRVQEYSDANVQATSESKP